MCVRCISDKSSNSRHIALHVETFSAAKTWSIADDDTAVATGHSPVAVTGAGSQRADSGRAGREHNARDGGPARRAADQWRIDGRDRNHSRRGQLADTLGADDSGRWLERRRPSGRGFCRRVRADIAGTPALAARDRGFLGAPGADRRSHHRCDQRRRLPDDYPGRSNCLPRQGNRCLGRRGRGNAAQGAATRPGRRRCALRFRVPDPAAADSSTQRRRHSSWQSRSLRITST